MARMITSRFTALMTVLVALMIFFVVTYALLANFTVYFRELFALFENQAPLAPEPPVQGVLRTPTPNSDDDDLPWTRHIPAHAVERAVVDEPRVPGAVAAPFAADDAVQARSIDPLHTIASPMGSPPWVVADGSTRPLAGAEPIVHGVSNNAVRFGMASPFVGINREGEGQLKLDVDAAFTKGNGAGGAGDPQLKLTTADGGDDDTPHPAVLQPAPPKPLQVVEVPKPLPLPDHSKPIPGAKTALPEAADPHVRVDLANGAARVQPTRGGYINAIQVYPWSEGALYQLYAALGELTDVMLEPGEQLAGRGPVAAGDTMRWIIDRAESGFGPTMRVHILVMPKRPDLVTNLVIDTDRRTYHLVLRSDAKTYMVAVSWIYPQDHLVALRRQNAAADAAVPAVTGVDISVLHQLPDRGGHAPLAPSARR